jgi:hypothetical protein
MAGMAGTGNTRRAVPPSSASRICLAPPPTKGVSFPLSAMFASVDDCEASGTARAATG